MSIYYYAETIDSEYIFDNFPPDLIRLIAEFKESQKTVIVQIDNDRYEARVGRKITTFGTIYVLTTQEKYVNRYKLFKDLIELSALVLAPLSKFKNDLITSYATKNEDFIHNLTSLNSYSIQGLYALIPQTALNGNSNKQIESVREIIISQPYVASKTLLKLIKHSLSTKVEFSVFERTMRTHQVAQKIDYSIRDIVLSILQIFMDDFEELKITISLDACEKRFSVDHDAMIVSLYYIFDNAIKYCCPNTDFKIVFKEENDAFSILFIMISARIESSEINKLTVRGYRSENVKHLNKEGSGIGMYRILKTLKFNDAILEILPRVNAYNREHKGTKYEANQFKIKFPGQQDWFKDVRTK